MTIPPHRTRLTRRLPTPRRLFGCRSATRFAVGNTDWHLTAGHLALSSPNERVDEKSCAVDVAVAADAEAAEECPTRRSVPRHGPAVAPHPSAIRRYATWWRLNAAPLVSGTAAVTVWPSSVWWSWSITFLRVQQSFSRSRSVVQAAAFPVLSERRGKGSSDPASQRQPCGRRRSFAMSCAALGACLVLTGQPARRPSGAAAGRG